MLRILHFSLIQFSSAITDYHIIDQWFLSILSLVLILRRCDKSSIAIFLNEVNRAAAEAAPHHANP